MAPANQSASETPSNTFKHTHTHTLFDLQCRSLQKKAAIYTHTLMALRRRALRERRCSLLRNNIRASETDRGLAHLRISRRAEQTPHTHISAAKHTIQCMCWSFAMGFIVQCASVPSV